MSCLRSIRSAEFEITFPYIAHNRCSVNTSNIASMPTHFKLKFNDFTRRVSFARQPNWQELSEKVSTLYSIPRHQVGVTYIDAEDEEITLNTEEELQDYYFSSYRPGETIKFSVRDLTLRDRRPPVPEETGFRNTFGQFVDADIPGIGEWQSVNNVPSLEEILGKSSPGSEVRSAFVESIASETSTVGKGAPDSGLGVGRDTGDAQSEASEARIPIEEKGKERAHFVRSMSSTQSLLAADMGDKHPVHVYDVSSNNRSPHTHGFSFDDVGAAVAAESTPRVSASVLGQDGSTFEKKPEKTQGFDDPPLPSFDSSNSRPAPQAAEGESTQSAQSSQASASLARDVASFLSAVSDIISSHPELGESLRTIARNTTNGTYWATHREAISQAAAELQRGTESLAEEGRRAVEEEAGRRVTEALAGVLSIFSQAPQTQNTTQTDGNAQPSNIATDFTAQEVDNTNAPPSSDTNAQPAESTNRAETPPMPGAFSSADFGARFGGSFPFGGRRWRARASMPPNFAFGGGFPAWAMPPRHSPFGPGVLNAPGAAASSYNGSSSYFNAFAPAAAPEAASKPDQTSLETSVGNEGDERLSPQDSKAKVEEAKKAYKAEKERYRRERDERRREKEKERPPKKGDEV